MTKSKLEYLLDKIPFEPLMPFEPIKETKRKLKLSRRPRRSILDTIRRKNV